MGIRQKLAEGKTKIIWEGDVGQVIMEAKDDLTAGDGAKHDTFPGKARLATLTTSNVFRLLQSCGVPVAFIEQIDDTRFVAERCEMIQWEVVARREAHGSCLKRWPELARGHIFPELVLELFLKTSGRRWGEHELPVDDPLAVIDEKGVHLYLPNKPLREQESFLTLDEFPLWNDPEMLKEMGRIAMRTFLILEKAWQLLDRKLVDFKVEFGVNQDGQLRLADVIDNDSWRVVEDGAYIDKQVYRDGGDLDTVAAKYAHVAALTSQFRIPRQQIVLWRASPNDDMSPFKKALADYGAQDAYEVQEVVGSLHKEPVQGVHILTQVVQRVPDSVIIVYVGRSNGAGPVLSAHTSVPVITVPAGWKEFPDDVWSSLRTPSETPVSTILEPANAVLHALEILAMRNPQIYAALHMRMEERWVNILMM